jgi:DNA-binding PadR family transcriptional regulator
MDQFSDPPLLVLTSLASGAKHGHAMLQDIESLCGTRLGPGTLYGAISRLESQGLIERLPSQERRQPYRMTAAGTRALQARLTTMRRIAAVGIARLAPR